MFELIFKIQHAFEIRKARIAQSVNQLEEEGYFILTTPKVAKDLIQARIDNWEAEQDLLKHFLTNYGK